jgi:hypothetical protein
MVGSGKAATLYAGALSEGSILGIQKDSERGLNGWIFHVQWEL